MFVLQPELDAAADVASTKEYSIDRHMLQLNGPLRLCTQSTLKTIVVYTYTYNLYWQTQSFWFLFFLSLFWCVLTMNTRIFV